MAFIIINFNIPKNIGFFKNKKIYSYKIKTRIRDKLRFTSSKNISINNFLNNIIIYEPILPYSDKEKIFKNYSKTEYDSTNIRYSFIKLYNDRKIFKINYSYRPYLNINKNISYDDNAFYIFNSTGMLNMTKLDYYYYNNILNTSNLNHIHISMSFDNNYILLSLVSIASILSTSKLDTYIHLHIILNNCSYYDIKPIIKLKKINKNVEFIFYNGRQSELDFGIRAKKEQRGIGDYSRILSPEIVNNTNKILLLHSADIIAQKDLSEIYFFNLGNNYFGFTLEHIAGRFHKTFIFGRNNFYPNGGVCLVNIREFRKDNLYQKAYFSSIAYKNLPCPFQDIFLIISNFKFIFMPLNFNVPQFFDNDEQITNKDNNTDAIKWWMDFQQFTPFRYNNKELLDAALDPVINHLYSNKPYMGMSNKEFTKMWIKYANLTDYIEEIKIKYPAPFNKIKKL